MKQHIISTLLISLLVFLAWNPILSQTFLGEGGYAYFFRRFSEKGIVLTFNFGAGILMDILVPLFKDNFFLYQGFVLISFTLICILFYFFVYSFTKRKDIGFIAAILFGVNYTTLLEMLGLGYFGEVVERVFFLVLFFPSLILFFMFKRNKKWYYYVSSLILCSASVFLAHFNMFFVTFFPVYIMAIVISDIKNVKKNFSELLYPIPFVCASFFIVSLSVLLGSGSFIPKVGLVSYIFNNFGFVVFNSMRQLVFLTYPENILRLLAGNAKPLYQNGMQFLFTPTILLYILIAVFIYKKDKLLRIPVVASFLFLPIVFVLNMFLRGDNVDHLGSGSRYLFVPSLGFAIFWAIFLSFMAKKINKQLVYLIIGCWIILQVFLLNRQFKIDEYKYVATKETITYIKKIAPKFSEDSIVIVPAFLSYYGAKFCNLFYGKSKTLFLPFYGNIEWLDLYGRQFDPEKDVILNYEKQKQTVLDRTKEYKSIIIEKQSK